MGIAVLGPLDVDGPSAGLGARDRVVLAALAMGPRRTLTAEQLADAVWGERPPPSWRKNLQGCVVRLRRALGPAAIVTTPQGYRLALGPDDVDADVFERLVARGRELLTLGEAERASYALDRALGLWRGPPVAELEDWEPGRPEVERLSELQLEAEELWLDAALRAGHHTAVLARAQAMARAQPLREQRWRLLALAEYQCGRQGEALHTLREQRRMLVRELGIEPDPESAALEQAILRQDPSLVVATAPAASERSPYLGLSPYGVADAESFFGRERDVAACLDRLRATGVLAVVGPSGVGKSSLVRAGVVAALRREGYAVEIVSPGVTGPGGAGVARRPVLVVDQCEEAFAIADPAARTAFLDQLVERAGTPGEAGVVLALRADRMGDLSTHPAFARLVERGLYLLGAMDEGDLRSVIEGPARQAGLVVEPGLVDLLLGEVEGEPAALPLLSHSLRETWARREGRSLTVAGYKASGGIRDAVARSAEEVYRGLDERQRLLLRDLFRRLVAPGPDGQSVLSRVPLAVVPPQQQEIVDTLIAARLLSSDETSVALTHEALVRAWPRLGRWLEEDLEGRSILHHLAGAAAAWDGLGRPTSELYRGTRLQRALDWVDQAHPELAPVERDFLAAGREHAEARERSILQRAREQARMIRRLRIVLTGAVLLLVAALAATGLAAQQRGVADRRAAEASGAEIGAVARAAGSAALVSDDVEESLLLAVAGVRLDDSVDTRRSLLAAIGRFPQLYSSMPLSGVGQVLALDASPRGRLVAIVDDQQRVRVYSAGSGDLLAERQVGAPRGVAAPRDTVLEFSPGGRTLAVAAIGVRGAPVRLLDARTLRRAGPRLPMPRGPGWIGTDVAFSGDGRHLAAALRRTTRSASPGFVTGSASAAMVWDLRGGRAPERVRLDDPNWQSIALSPDGSRLYTTPRLVEHDLVSGGRRLLDPRLFGSVAMGRDGRVLVAVLDGGVVVQDLQTGRASRLGTSLDVADARFAPDGRTLLLVAGNDRASETWRLGARSPRLLTTVALDRGASGAVDFAADGSSLYAASGDHALRRWDLTGRRELVQRDAAAGERPQAGFAVLAPGGGLEVYTPVAHVGAFAVHDLETGKHSRPMRWGPGYRHTIGAWHPDGRHYAVAVGNRLEVWDLRTATLVDVGRLPGRRVTEIDYDSDGSRLVVAETRGRVTTLSTRTWEPVAAPIDVGEHLSWVQSAPDGRTAVVLTGRPSTGGQWLGARPGWMLLDLDAGTVVSAGSLGMADGTWLGYSPDGRYAAVAGGSLAEFVDVTGADGKLAVIDLRAGRLVRPPVVAHQGVAFQLAYSPDGSRILTSGLDGTVALWDAREGTLLGRVTIEGRPAADVAFTPDGRSARIVEWWTGRVWTWPLDIERAVDHACRAIGRDLTRAEWRDHFGDHPYVRVCHP